MRWKQWSGYHCVDTYDEFHDPEYHAIRNGAGLIDVSPLYKYELRGKDALRMTDRLITRNMKRCAVGQVFYAPWCSGEGKILQDGTLQRLSEEHIRLTAADPTLPWLELIASGLDVQIDDVSESYGALAIQGPNARAILQKICPDDLSSLRFFWLKTTRLADVPVVVTRTGYTGDLGYELWMAAEQAVDLWDAVVAAGEGLGVHPAGLVALDRARVEAGFPLIDVDFWNADKTLVDSQKSTPFEVGLGWAVHLKKKNFVGKRALLDEKRRGIPRLFVGVEVSWRELERLYGREGMLPQLDNETCRLGAPIYSGGKQVGKATTTCWSPLLKKYLALATLDHAYHRPGQPVDLEITVEYVRRRAAARVVSLPFFDPPRKRA